MTELDKHGRLAAGIFDFQETKDGRILLYWEGKHIKTLKGKAAQKFLAQIDSAADEFAEQLIMAKATGNFKRGNERT